jgi:UDP-N-acetyl-D-mannosaminuronic acid transferase (WecB/TagA/CpsF family)
LPVGGLIDFLSNNKPRAPKLLRKTGLEWTYRLALEPKRMFGRYVGGIPIFLLRGLLTSKSDVLLSRKLSTGRNAGSSSGESPL